MNNPQKKSDTFTVVDSIDLKKHEGKVVNLRGQVQFTKRGWYIKVGNEMIYLRNIDLDTRQHGSEYEIEGKLQYYTATESSHELYDQLREHVAMRPPVNEYQLGSFVKMLPVEASKKSDGDK